MRKILTLLLEKIVPPKKETNIEADGSGKLPANPPVDNSVKENVYKEPRFAVIIDPGHYKYTPGKRSPEFNLDGREVQVEEWIINRIVTEYIVEFCNNNSIPYAVTTNDWSYKTGEFDYTYTGKAEHYYTRKGWKERLGLRINKMNKIAKLYDNILVFSIHHNAWTGSWHNTKRAEYYYHYQDAGSIDHAKFIANMSKNILGIESVYRPDSRLFKNGLYILRNAPSNSIRILTEFGYMDNKPTALKLLDKDYLREEAKTCIETINRFKQKLI